MSDNPNLPDGELLTLEQAAAEVGWVGKHRQRRMKRFLESKEAAVGRDVMTRVGRRRKITRGALRRHCPELFEASVDEFAKIFRRTLSDIDQKIDRKIAEHPVIMRIQRTSNTLQKSLVELAARVAKLA